MECACHWVVLAFNRTLNGKKNKKNAWPRDQYIPWPLAKTIIYAMLCVFTWYVNTHSRVLWVSNDMWVSIARHAVTVYMISEFPCLQVYQLLSCNMNMLKLLKVLICTSLEFLINFHVTLECSMMVLNVQQWEDKHKIAMTM